MESPRTGEPSRRFAYVLLWTMVVVSAAFSGWRLFGPDLAWPIVVVLSFTPYVALALLVPLLLAAWLRAIGALTILVLCACVLLNVLAPRFFAGTDSAAEGPALRVMTVNIATGDADLGEVAELVDDGDVDVLSVQELTPDAVEVFADSAVADRLPHQLLEPGEKAAGTGIYSRFALTENSRLSTEGLFHNPAATVAVPDYGELEFVAVHPSPPLDFERTKTWQRDLRALPEAEDDGPPRILAGDFNATLDHRTLRDLIDTGYNDAADATGFGLSGTWPHDRFLPKIALDHILTGPGITVDAYAVHMLSGGDHRAVSATVSLPAVEN